MVKFAMKYNRKPLITQTCNVIVVLIVIMFGVLVLGYVIGLSSFICFNLVLYVTLFRIFPPNQEISKEGF